MTGSKMYSPEFLACDMQSKEVRLLERVRDPSDVEAWREFVGMYQPVLTAFVRRNGVAKSDVLDVVQEILTKLVTALSRFEYNPNRGRFRTWLWRITTNAVTNWSRKQVSRARAEAAWQRNRTKGPGEDIDPYECKQVQLKLILSQAVFEVRQTTLPATWACFEGQILHGRTPVELASELGVTPNVVYVNTSRVRARVRKQCLRHSRQAEQESEL